MGTTPSLADNFLSTLDISVTELAALRGVSRQYATRDLDNFLNNPSGLTDLCRTLRIINTDSSRVMADRLTKFAAEKLNIGITVGATVSAATSKTYAQIFAENKELWIWAASPLDVEQSGYWEKLCDEFLDKPGRLLIYFVPTLELADRLALRFDTAIRSRLYDADGNPLASAEGFEATVFIIVTNLAASMPYVVLANPGSADFAKEGRSQSVWAIGKQAQDFFELPGGFGDYLIQKARAAGLGVARNLDNFFPMGQKLSESGIPFRSYPNVQHLIGIKLDHSVGLFDGEPSLQWLAAQNTDAIKPDHVDQHDDQADIANKHPLKFFPIFIKAYRRKAGEKLTQHTEKAKDYFKF